MSVNDGPYGDHAPFNRNRGRMCIPFLKIENLDESISTRVPNNRTGEWNWRCGGVEGGVSCGIDLNT
jgi:hypothetical protein